MGSLQGLLDWRPPPAVPKVAAGAATVVGAIGLAIHAAYLHIGGPRWVYPHFLGLWLALLTCFFGLQAGWQVWAGPADTARQRRANVIGFAFLVVVAFLLLLGYAVGTRADGSLWSTALLLTASLNLHLARLAAQDEPHAESGASSTSSHEQGLLHSWNGGSSVADSHAVSVNKPDSPPASVTGPSVAPCWLRTLTVVNAGLRVLGLLLTGLLLGGCWTQAIGWRHYTPRGSFYSIQTPTGETQSVHAWCTGPVNASLPTFWIEVGGGGHSMSDLWGLQFGLNARGRRVCTYDVPGCAWSGYAVPNQQWITKPLMDAMGETGPFILLATMDDGPERAYRFALDHPEMVRALVPMQYGPPEFLTIQQFHGWSDSKAADFARSQLSARMRLGDVIRGIAVQWGIMPAFLPPSDYVPEDLAAESRFLNTLNEKQWTTQVDVLASQVEDPTSVLEPDLWTSNRTLDAAIPVVMFFNDVNVTRQCLDSKYALDSEDCALLRYTAEAARNFSIATTTMTPGSRLIVCDDCDGLIAQGPNTDWAVENVMNTVGDILA